MPKPHVPTWVSRLNHKGFADYPSLSPAERIWFNVDGLSGQVMNGGLISFYYNSGADHVMETIADLETLGFPDIAGLFKEMNSWFPGGMPSADIKERNAVISGWPDGKYDSVMESMDEFFYARMHDLEQRVIQHIEANGLDRDTAIQ